MGGLAHIGMAFSRSTIGSGRHNLFEIILPASQPMAFFTVQSHGIAMDIKTFVAFGACLVFLSRPIKNLHLFLKLAGAQADDIFPFPERNHTPECSLFHRHNSTRSLMTHPFDGNALNLNATHKTCQKKIFPGHPGAIERRNNGNLLLRTPGYRRREKNTKPDKKIYCRKEALQQTCLSRWPVAALCCTEKAFQVFFLPALFLFQSSRSGCEYQLSLAV
ncbi:MAG: hypothetical protein ACYDHV_10870 [Desulfurivibrionaceae bacterium]